MPYKGSNLRLVNNYRALNTLPYNTGFSRESHKNALQQVYELPDIPFALVEKMIRQIHPGFSMDQLDRSPHALAHRESLSRDMRNIMLDTYLDAREFQASRNSDNPLPGVAVKHPWKSFVRQSTREEDLAFNRELEKLIQENDPVKTASFLFDELQRCGQELGVRSVQDLYDLRALSNENLISLFPQMHRYASMMEQVSLYLETNPLHFTPEQKEKLTPLAFAAANTANACLARMEMIANPYFKELGDTFFLSNRMSTLAFHANTVCADQKLSFKLVEFFSQASGYNHYAASLGEGPFLHKYPQLRNADFSVTGAAAAEVLERHDPLVAVTPDAEIKVVLAGHPDRLLSSADYIQKLSQEARDTGRWLLSGSRAFSQMQKAMDSITEYCQKHPQPDLNTLKELSERLVSASNDYLAHKKVFDPSDPDRIALRGKNAREQRRLDVAREALVFSRSLYRALDKAIKIEFEFADVSSEELLENPEILGIHAPRRLAEVEDDPHFVQNNQEEINARIRAEDERDGLSFDRQEAPEEKPAWQLALEVNTNLARNQLELYSQGTIKADDMVGSNATDVYIRQIPRDIAAVAFSEALVMENHVLNGTGVLQTMLREQGYDAALREFSSLVDDPKVIAGAGLKGYEPAHIGQFLMENGPRKLAQNLLQPKTEIQESHDIQQPISTVIEEEASSLSVSAM